MARKVMTAGIRRPVQIPGAVPDQGSCGHGAVPIPACEGMDNKVAAGVRYTQRGKQRSCSTSQETLAARAYASHFFPSPRFRPAMREPRIKTAR
jgi:hypothetical protein